jgi:hypothetical protein
MAELKWLEGYSGQSTDELLALDGEYRTDSIVLAFEQAVEQKAARAGCNQLTEEEKIILAIEGLEREVNNGGYSQFFYNSSKEYAPMIVDALSRIGCHDTAELTLKAIAGLGIKGSFTVDDIDNAMDADNEDRDDMLSKCDSRYYDVAGDLSEPLINFIKKNRDMIILS